jgi:ribosomal protein S18 acetylase RimI-like enzyme
MDQNILSKLEIIEGLANFDNNYLIKEIIDIDSACFGEFSSEDSGSESYWKEISKDSFIQVALIDNKIIGYINIYKFSDKGINMLEKGLLREGEMFEYLDRSDSRKIHLYIVAIAVLPEFRKYGIANRLLYSVLSQIKNDGYLFDNIYATVWSDYGAKFFNKFNPTKITHDCLGHDVIKIEI